MLTWPKASSTPSLAHMRLAMARSRRASLSGLAKGRFLQGLLAVPSVILRAADRHNGDTGRPRLRAVQQFGPAARRCEDGAAGADGTKKCRTPKKIILKN